MSTNNGSFHQLGFFVYSFQMVEQQVEDIIVLLMNADDEMVAIFMSELDFSEKLKTVDVLFSRFIDVRRELKGADKKAFHKVISQVIKLCERRNEILHSKYDTYQNVDGRLGLIRQNSRLRASKGVREMSEEELLPEALDTDVKNISSCLEELEVYRLKVLDWIYETDGA